MVVALPLVTSNIDCGGKAFHCVNSTHFMICVDLGGGVSSTIDSFVIPCPPSTVCEGNNHFECEFPRTTTVIPITEKNVISELRFSETTITDTSTTVIETRSEVLPTEANLNTVSTTTLQEDNVTTDIPVTGPSISESSSDYTNIVYTLTTVPEEITTVANTINISATTPSGTGLAADTLSPSTFSTISDTFTENFVTTDTTLLKDSETVKINEILSEQSVTETLNNTSDIYATEGYFAATNDVIVSTVNEPSLVYNTISRTSLKNDVNVTENTVTIERLLSNYSESGIINEAITDEITTEMAKNTVLKDSYTTEGYFSVTNNKTSTNVPAKVESMTSRKTFKNNELTGSEINNTTDKSMLDYTESVTINETVADQIVTETTINDAVTNLIVTETVTKAYDSYTTERYYVDANTIATTINEPSVMESNTSDSSKTIENNYVTGSENIVITEKSLLNNSKTVTINKTVSDQNITETLNTVYDTYTTEGYFITANEVITTTINEASAVEYNISKTFENNPSTLIENNITTEKSLLNYSGSIIDETVTDRSVTEIFNNGYDTYTTEGYNIIVTNNAIATTVNEPSEVAHNKSLANNTSENNDVNVIENSVTTEKSLLSSSEPVAIKEAVTDQTVTEILNNKYDTYTTEGYIVTNNEIAAAANEISGFAYNKTSANNTFDNNVNVTKNSITTEKSLLSSSESIATNDAVTGPNIMEILSSIYDATTESYIVVTNDAIGVIVNEPTIEDHETSIKYNTFVNNADLSTAKGIIDTTVGTSTTVANVDNVNTDTIVTQSFAELITPEPSQRSTDNILSEIATEKLTEASDLKLNMSGIPYDSTSVNVAQDYFTTEITLKDTLANNINDIEENLQTTPIIQTSSILVLDTVNDWNLETGGFPLDVFATTSTIKTESILPEEVTISVSTNVPANTSQIINEYNNGLLSNNEFTTNSFVSDNSSHDTATQKIDNLQDIATTAGNITNNNMIATNTSKVDYTEASIINSVNPGLDTTTISTENKPNVIVESSDTLVKTTEGTVNEYNSMASTFDEMVSTDATMPGSEIISTTLDERNATVSLKESTVTNSFADTEKEYFTPLATDITNLKNVTESMTEISLVINDFTESVDKGGDNLQKEIINRTVDNVSINETNFKSENINEASRANMTDDLQSRQNNLYDNNNEGILKNNNQNVSVQISSGSADVYKTTKDSINQSSLIESKPLLEVLAKEYYENENNTNNALLAKNIENESNVDAQTISSPQNTIPVKEQINISNGLQAKSENNAGTQSLVNDQKLSQDVELQIDTINQTKVHFEETNVLPISDNGTLDDSSTLQQNVSQNSQASTINVINNIIPDAIVITSTSDEALLHYSSAPSALDQKLEQHAPASAINVINNIESPVETVVASATDDTPLHQSTALYETLDQHGSTINVINNIKSSDITATSSSDDSLLYPSSASDQKLDQYAPASIINVINNIESSDVIVTTKSEDNSLHQTSGLDQTLHQRPSASTINVINNIKSSDVIVTSSSVDTSMQQPLVHDQTLDQHASTSNINVINNIKSSDVSVTTITSDGTPLHYSPDLDQIEAPTSSNNVINSTMPSEVTVETSTSDDSSLHNSLALDQTLDPQAIISTKSTDGTKATSDGSGSGQSLVVDQNMVQNAELSSATHTVNTTDVTSNKTTILAVNEDSRNSNKVIVSSGNIISIVSNYGSTNQPPIDQKLNQAAEISLTETIDKTSVTLGDTKESLTTTDNLKQSSFSEDKGVMSPNIGTNVGNSEGTTNENNERENKTLPLDSSSPVSIAEANVHNHSEGALGKPKILPNISNNVGVATTVDVTTISPRSTVHSSTQSLNVDSNSGDSVKKPVDTFCFTRNRGRYADRDDCTKFYICIGKTEPIVGKCPANTVFSEIKKQCTKNRSHCIRGNEFQCISEGRFSDVFRNNAYYICIRRHNNFYRFKFQCQNGYYLNKTTVKCTQQLQTTTQSSTSVDNSNSEKSASEGVNSKENKSKKDKDIQKESKSGEEFECKKEGKFPDPDNCRKYYVCTKTKKSEYRMKRKTCDSDEVFHKNKKKCVDADSYEC
ncbi:putative uncharacterized protein DDB_G0282133 [Ostrinia furnacalis]|uniref:putative uncharacterized protein DDB_G0282133 n=1 Tax=Ostrinia furnacalis TaxID=93504 RepID=UPI0010387A2E|nr:putative uncharacterized protein DDB_G0282133 [Ostrinia furnacalis]